MDFFSTVPREHLAWAVVFALACIYIFVSGLATGWYVFKKNSWARALNPWSNARAGWYLIIAVVAILYTAYHVDPNQPLWSLLVLLFATWVCQFFLGFTAAGVEKLQEKLRRSSSEKRP